jgi:hypothetical protein
MPMKPTQIATINSKSLMVRLLGGLSSITIDPPILFPALTRRGAADRGEYRQAPGLIAQGLVGVGELTR